MNDNKTYDFEADNILPRVTLGNIYYPQNQRCLTPFLLFFFSSVTQ